MKTAKNNQVQVSSIIRKLYVEHNGALVEVKQIDNPTDYADNVTIFTKTLVKGAKAGTSTYAVKVEDFKPKARKDVAAKLEDMLASGMTPEQIIATLRNK